jgi:phage tail sheath protein FI
VPTIFEHTPGVQIKEVRLGSPVIVGVPTAIAGFVGNAPTITGTPLPPGNQFPNVANLVTSADQFIADYIGAPLAPGDTPHPIATRSTPLSRAVLGYFANGGTTCYVVNVGTNDPSAVPAGLALLAPIDEVTILAAPSYTDNSVYTALRDQADSLGDRFAILDPPAALANPNTLTRPFDTKYAALYYPRIRVAPDLSGDPAEEFVSPTGHIAGIYARVDNERGVHKAPANEQMRRVLGVEQALTDANQEVLNQQGVNVIRVFSGSVVVWGARTLSTETDWRYINVRRLVNYIEESLQEGLRFAVFEPNTIALRQQITRSARGFLDGVWRDGGLFGASADEAYYVRFPPLFNRDEDRAQGKLTVEIGLRVTFPAEFVIIRIGLILQNATTV